MSEGRETPAILERGAIYPGGNYDEFDREKERETKKTGQQARGNAAVLKISGGL